MLAAIAGVLLGLIFLFASLMFFLHLGPMPSFPEGTPIAHFMAAMIPTHYMDFVKCFELAGGILVAMPRTRRLGLLLLGPVIVNIVASTWFIGPRAGFANPLLIAAVVLSLFLVWSERRAFAAFIAGVPSTRTPLPYAVVDENAPTRVQEGTSTAATRGRA